MASKYHLENSGIYLAGTDIPCNKLGITDSEELHELERELLEEAYLIFHDELDDETNFDEKYFKSLHHRTFENLYEWAGEYRRFNMVKGGSRFCQAAFLESESRKLFNKFAGINYLKNAEKLSKVEFVNQLAYFKGELITLHPFYELNGRTTRLFVDMIAAYNGYGFVDYSTVTPSEYIAASIDCVKFADCGAMAKIISDGVGVLRTENK
jgi:cell filamentation protein